MSADKTRSAAPVSVQTQVQACCADCGKPLHFNEIGATRKFINRGTEKFFCLHCLARHLDVPPALLEEKIEQFRRQGCTLFV